MKPILSLFATGFLQVFFVSVNTVFLSKGAYMGVAVAAFMISFIWSFNVKKVAFGGNTDRIAYSIGAMAGSLFGLYTSSSITSILQ